MKSNSIALVLLTAGMLTGCGAAVSPATPPAPLATITLTAENTSTVSKAALSTATQDVGGSSLSTVAVQTAAVGTDDGILYKLTDFALQKLDEQQSFPASVTGPAISLNCTQSGNFTLSSNATATVKATSFSISFSDCSFVTGETLNGSLGISGISRPTTSSLQGTVSIDLALTRLNLPLLKLVGGYNLSASGLATATRTDTLAGSSLVFTKGTLNEALTNFSFSTSYNTSGTPVVHNDTVSYKVSSDFTGGSFTFSTTTPFVKNATDVYPHAGVAVISGAGSSTIRVTVLGSDPVAANQVQIEFSANGMAYDAPAYYTWADLKN